MPVAYFGLVGIGSKVVIPMDHQTLANVTNCGFAPGVDRFGKTFFFNQASSIPQMFNVPGPGLLSMVYCSLDRREGSDCVIQGSQDPNTLVVTPTGVQFDMSAMTQTQLGYCRQTAPNSASYSIEYAYQVPGNINHVFTQTFDLVAPCGAVTNFAGRPLTDTSIYLEWAAGPAKVRIDRTVDGGVNWVTLVNGLVASSYIDTIAIGSPTPSYRIFSICNQSSIDYISVEADLTITYRYLGGKDPFRRARVRR